MITTRLFSILRRKYSLLDFSVEPKYIEDGVYGFRFKTDTDPGGTFATTVLDFGISGYIDPEMMGPQHVIQPGNKVRVIIDPSKHGVSDEYAFWIKLVYLDSVGSEIVSPATPLGSAATLVLPPFEGNAQSGFTGTAPSALDLSGSLRVDLPRSMENFRIRNLEETTSLYVAYQGGGPEVIIPAGVESSEIYGLVSSFWVRGSGGTASFTAQFIYANPR